ncbi:hypothetical protein V3W47_04245 [Deinococcus sp. YIM 134068]|uniref:DUF7933 domain-containing protein n=1 Tax=Deinococcus lichenicola TaxID=3118910 RepID=UPI002F91DF6A
MKRIFSRLLALAACASGGGLAVSGCTALYAVTNTGTTSRIHYINASDYSLTDVITNTGTDVLNGAALDPLTGNLYYANRTNRTLYNFDPDTRATTAATGSGTLSATANVGATFDNSGTLWLMQQDYTLSRVNKTTGAVEATYTINLPASDTGGRALTKDATTSGDLVYNNTTGRLNAILNGTYTTGGTTTTTVFYVDLGAPPTTASGNNVTGQSAVRMSNGTAGTLFVRSAINGLTINPVDGQTYVTLASAVGTMDSAGLVTQRSTTTYSYGDISDCSVLPDKPTISKAFGTSPIRVGGTTTLTITVGNPNPSSYYTETVITDNLPTGVTVATTPNASTTCVLADGTAATVTAAAGSSTITLPKALRIPPGGCTATVSVTGTTNGLKPNVITASGIVTTAGTPPANATATLTVNAATTGTLVKRQRNVTQGGTLNTTAVNARPGETVEYCLTATHQGVGYAPATVATLRDTLPTPLAIVTNGYGTGQGVRLTRDGGTTYTYATLASDSDAATYTSGTRLLSVNLLPFTAGTTVEACFRAQVP